LEGHIQGDFGSDIAFSPDGQLIASSSDESVRLSNAQTGRAYGTLEGHWGSIMKFAFSSDGQLLASTADDETFRIWDINAGSTCATSDAHRGSIESLSFSPDGNSLVSTADDEEHKLWNTETGAVCGTLRDGYTVATFSHHGQLIASASGHLLTSTMISRGSTVRLWNAQTGAAYGTLEGHTSWVTAVAFSPDGELLASASEDETVRLWILATWPACSILIGHSDSVEKVEFSQDGRILASASNDGTVRLWNTNTCAACTTFEAGRAMAFSPDALVFASASPKSEKKPLEPEDGQNMHHS
jgi:WD40 repeat protein